VVIPSTSNGPSILKTPSVQTKLVSTDPTYLRTIVDGLSSGALQKDNPSSLPQGLVGVYEEAIPPACQVNERKKFLEFFGVWVLLQKEVSVAFVAPLLVGWSEEMVLDLIVKFSKWFNSPESGKYVIYHERLRVFIMQKMAHGHFQACNEAIIRQCRFALHLKAGDECELYALHHFSSHLLIEGMITGEVADLKSFCRSKDVWDRQIELSSGLNWSILSIRNLIEFYSKYDPLACQEDYHNLLQLQNRWKEFVRHFNSIEVRDLNDFDIKRIGCIYVDNEFDAQYLYASIIVKIYRIIRSSLERDHSKSLIIKLDEALVRLHSLDHGKLNFHDVFPLSYFQELMVFYSSNELTRVNLLSGSYNLIEFEQGGYSAHKNYVEFIDSQFSFDLFPNNIPTEILDAIQLIENNSQSLNLSEILSLGQLYSFVEEQDINALEIPTVLMIIPLLFSKKFQDNKRYEAILSEWKMDICECYGSNITTFAFMLSRATLNINVDCVLIQKEIDWFAMNWLSSHKYDIDLYLSFVSEHIFWQQGDTAFENWILEMLSNRTNSDVISLLDDQKYQVLVDFYWGNDEMMNQNLTKMISPFQIRYYKEEAEVSKLAELDGDVITLQDTITLDSKDYLQSDFGTGPYIRSIRSVNSPVSVRNVDWVKILAKMKSADNLTLYGTMHKVYLKMLFYSKSNWADLPANAKEFYNLQWVEEIPIVRNVF
jgi:hypothetical protein